MAYEIDKAEVLEKYSQVSAATKKSYSKYFDG